MIGGILAGLLVTAAGLGLNKGIDTVSGALVQGEEVIAQNVSIGGVDVSGLTEGQATELLTTQATAALSTPFTLMAGEKSVQVTGMDIGLSWANPEIAHEAVNVGKSGNLLARYKDKKELERTGKAFDMVYTIDKTETAALLNAQADALSVKAMNAGLVKTANGFEMTGGQTGVTVDVQASLENISDYIEGAWDGNPGVIQLTTVVTEPEGSADQLSRVKDPLGTFHTDFGSSSAARCTNIERAASLINGTVVYPGETFSVAATIGPTNEENGYALAGAYENGQTVQAYGGGVCQVSSTLYNAVLMSELEVVERSPHSMLVSYVEPSRDAAIAIDSGKDFKFRNNTDAPIYIEGYTSNKQLFFTIYGEETRPSNRSISYVSEVLSETQAPPVFVASGEPIGYIVTTGSAHVGKVAELWKVVTVDGIEQSREKVNDSTYRATSKTVVVGVGSLDPNASAQVSAAIASGNSDMIYNAVHAYSGASQAAAAAAAAQAQQAAAAAAAAQAADAAAILAQ